MSHLALMARTRTSLSVHVLWKVANDVMQRILPQHLFSSSVAIGRQTPQVHHAGLSSGTGGTALPLLPKETKFLA